MRGVRRGRRWRRDGQRRRCDVYKCHGAFGLRLLCDASCAATLVKRARAGVGRDPSSAWMGEMRWDTAAKFSIAVGIGSSRRSDAFGLFIRVSRCCCTVVSGGRSLAVRLPLGVGTIGAYSAGSAVTAGLDLIMRR